MSGNRIAAYASLLILLFLELTLFNTLRIYGVKPELLLISTIFFGFHFGIAAGMEIGAVSGILKDIFSITGFGINTFSFLFIGFLSGYLKDKLIKENFITQFLLSFFCVFLISFYTKLWMSVLYKGLYTGFLAPFLFFIFARIFRK